MVTKKMVGFEMVSRFHIFFLVVLALFCSGCNTTTTVANNIPEREANEIVVLLLSKGIQATKVAAPVSTIGGGTGDMMWDISVPASQVSESLSILNHAGLPRMKGRTLLDLFGSQGLVPSDLQDRIRYQEGLSGQLASTIRKMDGIMDANVQITFPQDETSTQPLTASVYVKHRGILDNPNSLGVTKIKRLISSAIPGLTIENVSVITDRAPYADINLQDPDQLNDEYTYTSIWGIVLAKESVPAFRLVFYTFIILIFMLICLIAWLLWKFYPILQVKGIKTLYTLEPYTPLVVSEKTEEKEDVS